MTHQLPVSLAEVHRIIQSTSLTASIDPALIHTATLDSISSQQLRYYLCDGDATSSVCWDMAMHCTEVSLSTQDGSALGLYTLTMDWCQPHTR